MQAHCAVALEQECRTGDALQVVPAFENVVSGLEVGGTNKLRSEPEDCYGEWREDMVVDIPKEVRTCHAPPATCGTLCRGW